MTRQNVSVAVITLNERRSIARCLSSVAWADERIVVDTGSDDDTVRIARREGATVTRERWSGFAATKNLAIGRCRHEWILSLDADEWLSPSCAEEIRGALAAPEFDAYRIPRRSALSGGFVDRAWGGDRPIRLFRKTHGSFAGGPVHESVQLRAGSRCGQLRAPILHLSYRSIREYVERINRYTDLAAEGLATSGREPSSIRGALAPLAAFIRVYVLKRGFLDGRRGWIVAVGAAFYVAMREAKTWELGRSASEEFRRLVPATAEDPDPSGDQSG